LESDGTLLVATADPTDLLALEAITQHVGRTVRFLLAGPGAIQRAIARHYRARAVV
jgi:hypothetical protein